MRLRFTWAAAFVLAAPACFETKLIQIEASAGASSLGGATGAGGSAGEQTGDGGNLADAGAGDSPNSAGGKSSQGGKSNGGASARGGAANGGATARGGATATHGGASARGGAPATSGGAPAGITWLTFDGSHAYETDSPNKEFGINGVLYGYGDTCASLDWIAETRCFSGRLCEPGPAAEYWGIAIGFDFNNTGDDGSPPNNKMLWNPEKAGVRGIAWEISGRAPALQLWVLNMAPEWGGLCPTDSCDIAGPPDGDPAIALSSQLLFADMEKDNWGGTGEFYEYDPAAVHALQFKIPAVIARAQEFSFCIDRLGFIR